MYIFFFLHIKPQAIKSEFLKFLKGEIGPFKRQPIASSSLTTAHLNRCTSVALSPELIEHVEVEVQDIIQDIRCGTTQNTDGPSNSGGSRFFSSFHFFFLATTLLLTILIMNHKSFGCMIRWLRGTNQW